jgi:hypothetical protein
MKLILLSLSVLLSVSVLAQVQSADEARDTLKVKFRRYTVKKFQEGISNTWVIDVMRDNQSMYLLRSRKPSHLQFITIQNQPTFDINHDSIPEFILQEYLGGEQERTTWHILGFGREQFSEVARINTFYSAPWLGDYGGDGIFEIIVRDYTFANWNVDFLASPYIDVVLSWQSGSYKPAGQWMQTDTALAHQDTLVQRIKHSMETFYLTATQTYPFKANVLNDIPERRWGFIAPELWGTMFRLLYAGRADLAQYFLDKCWYEKLEGKAEFFQDFKGMIFKSPYWSYLKEWNRWEE